ncbi:hypothetical protein GGH99_007949, partial [Coemansia sp. RSA 1285]
ANSADVGEAQWSPECVFVVAPAAPGVAGGANAGTSAKAATSRVAVYEMACFDRRSLTATVVLLGECDGLRPQLASVQSAQGVDRSTGKPTVVSVRLPAPYAVSPPPAVAAAATRIAAHGTKHHVRVATTAGPGYRGAGAGIGAGAVCGNDDEELTATDPTQQMWWKSMEPVHTRSEHGRPTPARIELCDYDCDGDDVSRRGSSRHKERLGGANQMDKALPFDILCRIFVEAQWPTLAYVSRTLYEVSRSRAVRARYCVAEFGRHRVLDGRVGLAGRRPRMFQQDLVLLLLNMGADPRADDQWILRHACAQAWEPIVRKLLQRRVGCGGTSASAGDVRAEDSWRGGAAGESQESQIQNHGGSDTRMVDIHDDDDAALRIAAGRGQTGVVRILVRAGANVHVLGDEPLALAAGNGHTPAVRELLRSGAHAHADSSRALRTAIVGGDANADAIRLLLDAGARVAALDDSCVLAACYKGDGDFPPPPLLPPQQNLDHRLRPLTQAELL